MRIYEDSINMPKKKLTKAQVKRKMKTIKNMIYDLFLDKFTYTNSDVPFSTTKILELNKIMHLATKRIK
jgi:hypothetical protein